MSSVVPVIGRVYRAKRPRPIGFLEPLYDDRVVVWLGIDQVQYDSPSVKAGRRLPVIALERFIKWADRDVTDELPPGEWASYPQTKGGAA